MSAPQERVLVLSVDRDGDLERKTGIRSPIVGKDAVMSAATSLAVADPEEADANALFAAVKEYDRLRAQEVQCDLGAVCGLEESGYQADRKIRSEVETLLSKQQYSGIVLISDGAEDELVIPIPGATKASHATENAGALDWRLDEKELAMLDQVSQG